MGQNLSKKDDSLPSPTSVVMPLWVRCKENGAGWGLAGKQEEKKVLASFSRKD